MTLKASLVFVALVRRNALVVLHRLREHENKLLMTATRDEEQLARDTLFMEEHEAAYKALCEELDAYTVELETTRNKMTSLADAIKRAGVSYADTSWDEVLHFLQSERAKVAHG